MVKYSGKVVLQTGNRGKGPSGVLCKKHFIEKKGLRKNIDRQNMFNVLTEDEKLKLFSKSTFDHQHTVKIPEKKKCKMCNNQMFKEGLCKKHFKNRFFN